MFVSISLRDGWLSSPRPAATWTLQLCERGSHPSVASSRNGSKPKKGRLCLVTVVASNLTFDRLRPAPLLKEKIPCSTPEPNPGCLAQWLSHGYSTSRILQKTAALARLRHRSARQESHGS